jgi:superfamily I DNA/RNA helicase/RecB family exonuclease
VHRHDGVSLATRRNSAKERASEVCGLILGVPVTYRLVREAVPTSAPLVLDADQQRVADHAGGPLLVLAGPGTGKTATLVEAVARRVEAGADPQRLLVLTFSRRAAAELRERLARRLGATHVPPTARTFHAFCLQLLDELRAPYDPRPGLLGGPEQEVVVRELLAGDRALGRPWPPTLAAVLDTRGLAVEVRGLLAAAQSLGLGPLELDGAGAAAGREDWRAVARFYQQYRDVLAPQHLLDHGELVAAAAELVSQPEVAERLRTAYDAVWVDEYQDTDPRQEALLTAVAGGGRDLVVVGDPDQSIYAFRGAEVRNILAFPERFRTGTGDPAPVVALRTGRRSGNRLVAVARRIAEGLPTPGLPTAARVAHRGLAADRDGGEVEVLLFPSTGAEADGIADLLRRAHLDDGVAWSDMAVLVRSGQRSVPLLRRVLGAAGVPVEVAGDELPLAAEPAVATLMTALQCAADPARLTEIRCAALLASPLVAADAADLRAAGRRLRAAVAERDDTPVPPSSARLRRDAVADPAVLALLGTDRGARPLRVLADLLGAAGRVLAAGGSAEEALWEIWAGSRWRERLAAVAGGRGPDARSADRDLDAVLALFDAVARAQQRRQGIGVTALLETLAAQVIPAGTQDERALTRPGVRLLTAHRSKGLEWPLVVVAGVQEGGWPDLRTRGSLLDPAALAPQGAPGRADLLADERRLFYVAATRARERLVVTAVDAATDDGSRPSRFLAAVGITPTTVARRAQRPRTLAGLVAELRRLAVDDPDDEVRAQAAARLAGLAAERDDAGLLLVPSAAPTRWWGLAPPTEGPAPYDPDQPLPLSTSTLTALQECSLQWFLSHEVHADTPASPAMSFGKVVHALADMVARGELADDPATLAGEIDRVWPTLGYEAAYQADAERRVAVRAMEMFAAHLLAAPRRLVGSELGFDDEIDTPGGVVRVRGRLDRVELADDGGVVVIDLKTGRVVPSGKAVAVSPQLRLYQYAVDHGMVEGVGQRASGAELWQLRDGSTGVLKVQPQAAQPDHEAVLAELGAARLQILDERFPAVPEQNRCERCAFAIACPATPAGRQVV